jgi:hypothetical protein
LNDTWNTINKIMMLLAIPLHSIQPGTCLLLHFNLLGKQSVLALSESGCDQWKAARTSKHDGACLLIRANLECNLLSSIKLLLSSHEEFSIDSDRAKKIQITSILNCIIAIDII